VRIPADKKALDEWDTSAIVCGVLQLVDKNLFADESINAFGKLDKRFRMNG
jgi:hypothetical protein